MATLSTLRLVDIPPEAFLAAAGTIPLIGYPFYGNVFEPGVLLLLTNVPTVFINFCVFVVWLDGKPATRPDLCVALLPILGLIVSASRAEVEPCDQPSEVKEELKSQPRVAGIMAFWVIMLGLASTTFKLYNNDLPIMTINNISVLLACFGGVPLADAFFRDAFVNTIFVPTIARNGPDWHDMRKGSWGKAVETGAVITYIGSLLGFALC